MSLTRYALLLIALCTQGFAQNTPAAWAANLDEGNAAFSTGKYELSQQKYREALKLAEEAQADATVLLPILKSLAAALRTSGDLAEAQQAVERTLALVRNVYGENSLQTASALSELAIVQRSREQYRPAIQSLEEAIRIRSKAPLTAEAAYDATLMANIWRDMEHVDNAIRYYQTALDLWGALPSPGLQILTAIDPYAAILRDIGHYNQAEELLTWALHLREAAFGPKGSELISTIDSLAYVRFGLKKYADAEGMYTRLLALWETAGGPEHPMLALTLDKMAEFYIEQKRYDAADPLVQRALALRLKMAVESLHRTGRVMVGEEKFPDATDLYGRTLRMAAEMRIPDEELPGVLRTYSLLLRQLHRDKEADVLSKRIREATDRKAAKEGRRTLPPPRPGS